MRQARQAVVGVASAALLGLAFMLLGGGSAIAGHAGPPSGNGVQPVFVPGNPDCAGLGYTLGFKPQPEPPPDGLYQFPADPGNTVTISNNDGTFFDWASTLGIDAVIVKGGPDADAFVYPLESFSDTGLHAPINHNNDQPFAISHIEFCYDYEVTVEKTAETSFTRTFEWDISKTVTPETWDLFTGDTGTSKYTVEVSKTGFTDSDWAVTGTVWVTNDTPFPATIESVTDVISGIGPVPICGGVAFPLDLGPGDSLHCGYGTALPDGSDRVNTATVETSGDVGGGEATADIVFGDPTTEVNGTINVDDTNGDSWQFDDSGMVMYERTFGCDGDEGQHDNTATIVETNQSDSASVTVNCYALGVEKTAETTFTRTWEWSITKTADQTDLILSPGQVFDVTYWVDVDASSTDSDHAVSGEIWISNPNPVLDADLTEVADVVSPNIAANVNCPALTVPAGGSLHCTYEADLPDGSDRTNTATATLQNNDYDKDGNAAPAGTTDFSGSADVAFDANNPTNEVDECIDVTDSEFGPLGNVCASQAPASFHYVVTFGPFADPDDCGDHDFPNTASFETNDTGTTGDDSWNVHVFVACEGVGGCTLTLGYWKTHSMRGPAPYDDTWALIGPMQHKTLFFGSGEKYIEVLWTSPKGNAWYILARQYIAAELNMLNGASVPADVQDAFNLAAVLLQEYDADGPKTIGKNKIPKGPDRKPAIQAAKLLDQYNNGIVGPGHCDEQ